MRFLYFYRQHAKQKAKLTLNTKPPLSRLLEKFYFFYKVGFCHTNVHNLFCMRKNHDLSGIRTRNLWVSSRQLSHGGRQHDQYSTVLIFCPTIQKWWIDSRWRIKIGFFINQGVVNIFSMCFFCIRLVLVRRKCGK
jgi:hypothetical protein